MTYPFPDIDDPRDWEVIADGSDTQVGITVRITIDPDVLRPLVEAAHRDNMDVTDYIQRAVQ